ncbi:MAG: membrane-bound lytic murein transglycosylase MltF [Halieaceae bacterium]|jgi:membrane-bound lytic murein transglycosylase F|nr:membrane-bound lytic murein transglycosylase MltF [Halieaceae bacterium]
MHPRVITVALTFSLILVYVLSACDGGGDALHRIQSRGELKVATRNSPTTYYLDRDGPNGFEYALAGLLAADLGVELEIESAFTLDGLFQLLNRGEVDLAAAGLTLTRQRADLFPHSSAYYKLKPQVVYVAGTRRPLTVEELPGRTIVVLANSSHADELARLRDELVPELQWQEIAGADTMELLEMLDTGQAELAVIDSNEFTVQRSLYPRLKVAFDLLTEQEQDMVWYLAPGADNRRLQAYIDQFFLRLQEDGTLEQLRDQYFGHTAGISRISSHTFNQNMRSTLPQYKGLIQQVAREYQMEWQLLAAIAYQESHWDPLATSPTGVRGLMMLTLPTAEETGVTDRLDPLQSLRGGARYLKDLKRRLPGSIKEPDRGWFALAAYNIGLGHLEDARVLTQRQGGDPNRWQDVIERLPLLQKSSHYRTTRYGYARGVEAATYVQNIRHYHNILNWQDITDNKPLPPLKVEDYLPQVLRGSRLSAL